jgi:hypothetical protein
MTATHSTASASKRARAEADAKEEGARGDRPSGLASVSTSSRLVASWHQLKGGVSKVGAALGYEGAKCPAILDCVVSTRGVAQN